jgi:hypothetical protein
MSVILNPLTGQLEYIPTQSSSITPIQIITTNTTLSSSSNQIYEIGNLTANITITLPPLINGWECKLLCWNESHYTVTLTAGNNYINFGNTEDTSITLDNVNEGNVYYIICDGNSFNMNELNPIGINTFIAMPNYVTVFNNDIQELIAAEAGIKALAGYNTIDDGNGNSTVTGNLTVNKALNINLLNTLTGTTAGNVQWSQYMQGKFKAFAAQFIGYKNSTTTNQSITFTTPFVNTPVITSNTTGLTITANTTTLTINTPNNTTAYNGIVEVKGF